MDIQAEKLLLIEQLLQIRVARLIAKIRALLRKGHNPVVEYELKGKPITRQDLIQQIAQAETEYKSGNYQALNEVERELETW
jgi:ribulose bisphosphate carboxylase small subunit